MWLHLEDKHKLLMQNQIVMRWSEILYSDHENGKKITGSTHILVKHFTNFLRKYYVFGIMKIGKLVQTNPLLGLVLTLSISR